MLFSENNIFSNSIKHFDFFGLHFPETARLGISSEKKNYVPHMLYNITKYLKKRQIIFDFFCKRSDFQIALVGIKILPRKIKNC